MKLAVQFKKNRKPLLFGFTVGVVGMILILYGLAQAATGVIRPDGVGGTSNGTQVTCGGGGNYDCLNEVITAPTVPSTGTDYLNQARDNIDFMTLGTFTDVLSASQVNVQVHHVETKTNMALDVSLWNAAETTQYGSTITFTNRASPVWDVASFTGLTLTQAQLDGLRVRLRCTRPGTSGALNCHTHALYADVTYSPVIEVNVSSIGAQQNILIGATNAHVGGRFAIVEAVSNRNITGITITENGTVNAQTNLNNIKLLYEFDTVTPFDCASVSYDGTEPQFGVTDTDGFSGANGTSAFASSTGQNITTTKAMCVYVVMDVGAGAAPAETVEIEITDPSIQVTGTGSPDVRPVTPVLLSGTTVLQAVDLRQMHYHWRLNDVETEAGASSATGGTQDTPYLLADRNVIYRLRTEVSNEGNITSAATQYRVEFAKKITTCQNIVVDGETWIDVGAVGGDWDMADVATVADGANTTNIATAGLGAMTDENTTFLTPNAAFKDTSSQTSNITLTSTQFVELEYAMKASLSAVLGTTYCFRVTNAGATINNYNVYPELLLKSDLTVTVSGSQPSTSIIPNPGMNIANFVIKDVSVGAQEIQSITISASGTVDYQNDIDNIILKYDLDTSNPYDCIGETYDVGDAQFGSTDTDGFSGAGKSTFTDSEYVNTTSTMCLHVVLDATSGVTDAETLDIYMADPSTDIVVDAGNVSPTNPLPVPEVTTFIDSLVNQVHYHWRNNDGDEVGATSATEGDEDTALPKMPRNTTYRLRLGVANPGGEAASAQQYQLEWGRKITSCSVIAPSSWYDVDIASDEFTMASSLLVHDSNTTNIDVAVGGTTDEASTFITSNGGQQETDAQTGNITLTPDTFVELEYSIQATNLTIDGTTYCFRVTDNGTALETYDIYPEAVIRPAVDFKVTRGVSTIPDGSTTLTLTESSDYDLDLNDASRAFIRITNTSMSAAGEDTFNTNQPGREVLAYISNPANIATSITFTKGWHKGDTRIAWEVLEYVGSVGAENEIVVRSAQLMSYTGAQTSITSGSVSGIVDDADVLPFITSQGSDINSSNYYQTNLSTSQWNAGGDTVTLQRGASEGIISNVSVAVVEFTGANWKIQRSEHTYSAVGTLEGESITAVNSLTRTFLHNQKRVGSGLYSHANFGQEVYLSGIGTLQHYLDGAATSAGSHTSVTWIVENTQTLGQSMKVWRSNGTIGSSGVSPQVTTPSIGTTLDDMTIASIFANARTDGTAASYPEPIISTRLLNNSPTTYEIWIADPQDNVNYRTEVVEWPTALSTLYQNYYRLYVDNDALTPTDPWPVGGANLGENAEMTALDDPIASGETIRIRMTLQAASAKLPTGVDNFKLEYAERPDGSSCSALSTWQGLAPASSSTALWRGAAASPADGTTIDTLLITSVADEFGTYEEENFTNFVPNETDVGDDIEYDWNIQHNAAKDKTDYCFRMTYANGLLLKGYNYYPVIRTVGYEPVIIDWKWFDDETSITPVTQLAAINVAPVDIVNENIVKLRTTIEEVSGGTGTDIKFKLQFSEQADFSSGVHDVVSSTTCATVASTTSQLWCYDDGAGVDNAIIDESTLPSADSCSGGSGDGCATHNEGADAANAVYDQVPLTTSEYEFTLRHDGARANVVYYFRLYDVVNDEVVAVNTTHPSLVTEGAQLVSTMEGVISGTTIAGVTSDVTTTPTSIGFGSLPFGTSYEAMQQITIDTNSTEGYQLLMYATQQLTNTYGDDIPAITSTNAAPAGWLSACTGATTGCFGYHTTDATLFGGSGRFAPTDSYSALNTNAEEVMFSSIPVNDVQHMIYRILVSEDQPAGDYQTSIVYIAVPTF